jgi:hypothetical protein
MKSIVNQCWTLHRPAPELHRYRAHRFSPANGVPPETFAHDLPSNSHPLQREGTIP